MALEGGRRAWQAEGTANVKAPRLEPAWGVPGTERVPGWLGTSAGREWKTGVQREKGWSPVLCRPCSGRWVEMYSECLEDSRQRGDVFAFTF